MRTGMCRWNLRKHNVKITGIWQLSWSTIPWMEKWERPNLQTICYIKPFSAFAHICHIHQNFGTPTWSHTCGIFIIVQPCNKKKNERRCAGKNKMSWHRMTNGNRNNISKSVKLIPYIKDVTKIRLYMQNTKCNYKRNESDTHFPHNTKHMVIASQEGNNTYILLIGNKKYWDS